MAAGAHRLDLGRPGFHQEQDQRCDRLAHAGHVDLVGQRVQDLRVGVGVEDHLAGAVVTDAGEVAGSGAQLLHHRPVLLGRVERHYRTEYARHVVDALEPETEVHLALEVVHEHGVRRAPPGADVLSEDRERSRGRVQVQVLADRRATDPRAQQHRRGLQRSGGDDHVRRAHSDCGGAPRCRVNPGSGDAGGATRFDENTVDGGVDQDPRTRVVRVLQIGDERGLLGPALVAESDVAGGLRRVALGVDVAVGHLGVPAEPLRGIADPLEKRVQVTARPAHAHPLRHRI